MSSETLVQHDSGSTMPRGAAGAAKLFLYALLIVALAEAIGNVSIPIGVGKIVLLPLLWALLLGAALGLAGPWMPPVLRLSLPLQAAAADFLQPALLIFVAKLGLMVGASLPKLLASGWAFLFQELGHFFGTMVFGLPVALLLGIKREAIGATFSVGREPSLAIIGERYGMDSPEGRGVLAEYLTGTVFGAIFIALLAGLTASLKLFDPLALAMGAGVGSGSMMAAASGAIAAQQTPAVAKQVATFAAASNLVTTTVGTYFTLFVSLPFTVWAYGRLEPILGGVRRAHTPRSPDPAPPRVPTAAARPESRLGIGATAATCLLIGAYGLVGNWLTYGIAPSGPVLAGDAVILSVVLVGWAASRLLDRKVPAILCTSLIGMALTFPGMPFAAEVGDLTGRLNFLALATPILAFAGLSIARDVPAFRRLGWRIVLVSVLANAGTFLGAALIAQSFMRGAPL